ncbi:MAG: IS21 family transposase [Pseudomonadota bacterium]
MPTPRITMRQLRELLRLHLLGGRSYAECGRALGVAKSTAGKIAALARAAGLDWSAIERLSDEQLEARLYRSPVPRCARQLEPDYAHIHQELKRPGVTLQLLWEEYARGNERAYKYTSFCVKYRQWRQALALSMRQTHVAGERLFIDYAGQTVAIVDAASGAITPAQIFVAVLGASNYTFACATLAQTSADWIGATVAAFEFIGGVPVLVVPDQTRALIAQPSRYEPQPNRLAEEFAAHYGVTILPARPAHPRDKPKVEAAVLLVERWILARLRHRRFFSLAALNAAVAELLAELNARPFKKLPGSRASAFEQIDAPALRPLPAARFMPARWKTARVNIDYHIDVDGHYYSVPYRLVRTQVQVRVTAATVEVFAAHSRVACHAYSSARGRHTTVAEHMPAAHRAHREWTPAKLLHWAERIGPSTAAVVRWQPEQGYRACLGLQRLARACGAERLEAACARALAIGAPLYRSVDSILKRGVDRQPLAAAAAPLPTVAQHDNVRGPDYYH